MSFFDCIDCGSRFKMVQAKDFLAFLEMIMAGEMREIRTARYSTYSHVKPQIAFTAALYFIHPGGTDDLPT